ncbi:hypothetical protein SACT1_7354 [Streptomyces sp. ACT-1]|nr:hypothetical protein SACT1_0060 [Streptomyces sp. ACT-1]EGE46634.1 hypothetical protein SACT1_7354 [Streptomyces sp. ACT-1]
MPMEIFSPSGTSRARTAVLPADCSTPQSCRHPDMRAGGRSCTAAGVRGIRAGGERQGISTMRPVRPEDPMAGPGTAVETNAGPVWRRPSAWRSRVRQRPQEAMETSASREGDRNQVHLNPRSSGTPRRGPARSGHPRASRSPSPWAPESSGAIPLGLVIGTTAGRRRSPEDGNDRTPAACPATGRKLSRARFRHSTARLPGQSEVPVECRSATPAWAGEAGRGVMRRLGEVAAVRPKGPLPPPRPGRQFPAITRTEGDCAYVPRSQHRYGGVDSRALGRRTDFGSSPRTCGARREFRLGRSPRHRSWGRWRCTSLWPAAPHAVVGAGMTVRAGACARRPTEGGHLVRRWPALLRLFVSREPGLDQAANPRWDT